MPIAPDFDYESSVEACARGDLVALHALYARESRWLLGVAKRIVRDHDAAQDVLQEAFMQIWQRASTYQRALGSARGWIYTVVRHQALDESRRAAREFPASDGIDSLSDAAQMANASHASDQPDADALGKCLERLAPRHRDCVVSAFVEGYTHEQIASRLEAPLGSVKSWIRRGLLSLKECLT